MARKTLTYTVTDEGRDRGKSFLITELPASRAESWAMRALLALMAGGVDVPEGIESMGMAAMAEVGIRAVSGLQWEVAEPLLDEMWQCVQFIPDTSKPHVIRGLIEEDIEEVKTRIALRQEVWKLHVDFFSTAAQLESKKTKQAAQIKSS